MIDLAQVHKHLGTVEKDWHKLPYVQLVWLKLDELYEQLVWPRWTEFGVQTQIDWVGWCEKQIDWYRLIVHVDEYCDTVNEQWTIDQ